MPVLIGVVGGPTLGQDKYNMVHFQTRDRYTCVLQKNNISEMFLLIFKVYYIHYKLFRYL